MSALYNEIDAHAAQWIRNLVGAGLVAPGEVEERSVRDLRASDVGGATQFHAFAGIAVWSHALRLAGWPDDVPVWTGSCPCQPFSSAGRRGGIDDERHLWPDWFRLIAECRPPIVLGEQVASKDGLAWLDAVLADLEGAGYACAAFDLCAAGVGAPHIRQRLYFVAADDAQVQRSAWCSRLRREERRGSELANVVGDPGGGGSGRDAGAFSRAEGGAGRGVRGEPDVAEPPGADGHGLADGGGEGLEVERVEHARREREAAERGGATHKLADDDDEGRRAGTGLHVPRGKPRPAVPDAGGNGATRGFWSPADWVACTDGKSRPVEPGTFPLAHGVAGRVGKLRAYGNAIVAPLATEFIEAVMAFLSA